jgi:hypothetical protein
MHGERSTPQTDRVEENCISDPERLEDDVLLFGRVHGCLDVIWKSRFSTMQPNATDPQ